MFSAAVCTLGCKLNQIESEALAAAFRQAGFSLLPWAESVETPADLVVVNTCTVTSKADQKARRVIRKALRDNSCVVVTGCYAQLESEVIAVLSAAPEDDAPDNRRRLFVVKGGEKGALLDLPRFISDCSRADSRADSTADSGRLEEIIAAWDKRRLLLRQSAGSDSAAADGSFPAAEAFRFAPEDFSFHSRSFLKIQDGCDRHCSYCRVRLARGKSVSIPPEKALAELRTLEAKGFAEAVLAGVNISQYRGNFAATEGGLGELIKFLLAGTERIAIRLSSLDPGFVNESFAAVLANRRIRPHFHLSVQSGSEAVLERMERGYNPQAVEKAAALLRSIKEDPFLACDIIAGFPGETHEEFEKTLALCRQIGFAWIHPFPFSKRPGTTAFSFKETVSRQGTADRVAILTKLAHLGRQSYIHRWQGRELEALVESGAVPRPGFCRATSENYLKLLIKYAGPETPQPGAVLYCKTGNILQGDFDAEAEEIVLAAPQ